MQSDIVTFSLFLLLIVSSRALVIIVYKFVTVDLQVDIENRVASRTKCNEKIR